MGRDSQPLNWRKPNPLTKRRKAKKLVMPLQGAETFHAEDFEGVPPSQWHLVRAGWWPPQRVRKDNAEYAGNINRMFRAEGFLKEALPLLKTFEVWLSELPTNKHARSDLKKVRAYLKRAKAFYP